MSELCGLRIKKQSWKAISNILLFAGIASVSVVVVSKTADISKEETMKYDFHARMKLWNRTIEMADRKSPSTPISVTCLNLALAVTDRMGDRMFNYFQNGPQGLLADFVRDYTSPLSTAEAYYHLGMINTAQRFVFEAQEAIPDYHKSARCYARLAETNLINGDYDVARKYLLPLTHTLFYKKWAESVLALRRPFPADRLRAAGAIQAGEPLEHLRVIEHKAQFGPRDAGTDPVGRPDRNAAFGRTHPEGMGRRFVRRIQPKPLGNGRHTDEEVQLSMMQNAQTSTPLKSATEKIHSMIRSFTSSFTKSIARWAMRVVT